MTPVGKKRYAFFTFEPLKRHLYASNADTVKLSLTGTDAETQSQS